MDSWEHDSDAWKDSEDKKPWEEADAWKLERGYEPGETEAKRNSKVNRQTEIVAIGIRPTVPTTEVANASDIRVKDRDALKLVTVVSKDQKAFTEEGELFQFSIDRYMWMKIP